MKSKKNPKKERVICLVREFSQLNYSNSGNYVLGIFNENKLVPDGAPKTFRDLHPFIEGRKYTTATKSAKKSLLEKCNSGGLRRYICRLDVV